MITDSNDTTAPQDDYKGWAGFCRSLRPQDFPNLTASDTVHHPQHYSRWTMEPIEFIAINNLPWWLANVIKYTMRFDAKDGLKDLHKARSYLDMKIRQVEGDKQFWKPVDTSSVRRDNEKSAGAYYIEGACGNPVVVGYPPR